MSHWQDSTIVVMVFLQLINKNQLNHLFLTIIFLLFQGIELGIPMFNVTVPQLNHVIVWQSNID